MENLILLTQDDLHKIIEATVTRTLEIQGKKQSTTEGFLDRREVARLLKISLPTLWDLMKKGAIPYSKIGRRVLFKPSDVEKFVENHHK